MANISKQQLNSLQERACDIIRENPALTYATVGSMLGVSERTVWQWYYRDTNNFKAKWDEALQDAFKRLEGRAIQSLGALVDEKNFSAVKYVLDNRNYGATQKIKADVDSSVDINISIKE